VKRRKKLPVVLVFSGLSYSWSIPMNRTVVESEIYFDDFRNRVLTNTAPDSELVYLGHTNVKNTNHFNHTLNSFEAYSSVLKQRGSRAHMLQQTKLILKESHWILSGAWLTYSNNRGGRSLNYLIQECVLETLWALKYRIEFFGKQSQFKKVSWFKPKAAALPFGIIEGCY
jgi:hypothetical protein